MSIFFVNFYQCLPLRRKNKIIIKGTINDASIPIPIGECRIVRRLTISLSLAIEPLNGILMYDTAS